jgi:hypothetical protein
MIPKEGKYTAETFAKKHNLARQSAINLLSKLKKRGYVRVSGGGRQKRIYTIRKLPQKATNGFYDIINRYSPEKLNPAFEHFIHGDYTVEQAIIDGIMIGDSRTRNATMHLFRHVKNWKYLFDLAKKKDLRKEVVRLYNEARKITRCKRMPGRYEND